MSSPRYTLRRLAREVHLEVERLDHVDNGPTWFQRIPGLFELGRAYHTLLQFKPLAGLRCNIVSVLRKPGEAPRSGLVIRCLSCGAQPIDQTENGFRCNRCDRLYPKEGNVVRGLE